MELNWKVHDRVRLYRGVEVTVTDMVDQTAEEVIKSPDNLSIGIDNHGNWYVFPPHEVVAVLT